MLDASDLIGEIITVLGTNSTLLALLDANALAPGAAPGSPPAPIFPYYHDGAFVSSSSGDSGTNFERAIQTQPEGTIMIAWRGTRTGRFTNLEVTKHDFAAYIKPIGRATTVFQAFVDGVCTVASTPPQTGKFRLLTIDPKCQPPESIQLIPQPTLIAQGYAVYDMLPISFTLTEKGLDT